MGTGGNRSGHEVSLVTIGRSNVGIWFLSSRMLLSVFYISFLKRGTSLDFFILPLLFLLFLYTFFKCFYPLLRNPGGRSRTEPLHHIAGLLGYISPILLVVAVRSNQ